MFLATKREAGAVIDVNGKASADGYVFVGWTTEDVDITAEGKFEMPEKDVVLYGYFRKPVTEIKINKDDENNGTIILDIDKEHVIEVDITPEGSTVDLLIFVSDDNTIVIVDETGKVTAVGGGTTTITVTAKDDPNVKDTVTVTVKIPVTDITVNKNEFNLNKGDTDKITVTEVLPSNATNKGVTYKSDDEDVVKVDENGNSKAIVRAIKKYSQIFVFVLARYHIPLYNRTTDKNSIIKK